MTSLLAPALIAPLEKLLNGLLQQDSLALKKLQTLTVRSQLRAPVIEIHCTGPLEWRIYLILASTEIQLRSTYDGPVAAGIHGSAGTFSKLMLNADSSKSLISPGLVLEGDSELIQGLHQLLTSLDIDWQTPLSRLSGDSLTHQFSQFLQSASSFGRQSATAMQQNLTEFLQEESRLLPEASELNAFYEQVDTLRLRLDRLQARLENLQNQVVTN